MRYLGIDYGSKKVGLSISDEEGNIAFPYKTIGNSLELVDTIHNICGKEEVSAVVLGESQDFSGKPNKIMGSIEEFKRNLEIELDLPVFFEKEFMTSVYSGEQKSKNVFIAKKIKKEKVEKDDSKAATLILQRYLDRKNLK
jgi:putative Holliday junction resolvase